jgi:hypothetical protein
MTYPTLFDSASSQDFIERYQSARGTLVGVGTTSASLFTDDFGGTAIDTTKWDVLDGGLGANVNLGYGTLTQAAIGSGTTGITEQVTGSGLVLTVPVTSGAERWYLSKQVFAGKEDILVILSKSATSVNTSIFVGLCEVDPVTRVPLLNPNLANDFTNRGGVEFGATVTATVYHCEAVSDSSDSVASGGNGTATSWVTAQECLIEIDSRDITAQTALVDSVAGKVATGSRVSTQCPNDQKLYKLIIRVRNTGVAGGSIVTVKRILVVDNYEQRVQISTGEGDLLPSKALPVALTNNPADNAAVAANPIPISGVARSSNRVAATTLRAVSPTYDLAGNVVVKSGGIPQTHLFSGKVALANTTETTLIAAGGATVRNMIQTLIFANLDTVKHIFDVRDATAGTIQFSFVVPTADTRTVDFPSLACAAALNTAWTVQMREAVTTTNPEVSASGYATTA